MQIITSDEIARSGALDIPQILRRVAGIDVTRGFKGGSDVNVRGYNQPFSNRLLTLINGRQVYMDIFGMTVWHSLPVQLSEIKQIEVVRGPNTSLFGFNAVSGVINIVTFDPNFDPLTTVSARVGTQNHYDLSGVATIQPTDNFSLRLSLGGIKSDGFSRKNMPSHPSSSDAIDKESFNIDSLYNITSDTNLRFDLGINDQTSDVTVPFVMASYFDSIMKHFSVTLTHANNSYGNLTVKYYVNDLDLKHDSTKFATMAGTEQLTMENILHVFQISDLFSVGTNHNFRLGFEYRDNQYTAPSLNNGHGKFSMDIFAANAMWDWQIKDNLSFTNALRLDHWTTKRQGYIGVDNAQTVLDTSLANYSRSELEYSFNSGLVLSKDNNTNYRATLARGLHIPALTELGMDEDLTVLYFYGNPHLNAESNLTLDLGYSKNFSDCNLKFDTNLYYQKLDNLILSTVYELGGSGGAIADFTFENVGDSQGYGLEVMLSGKAFMDMLTWHANYNLLLLKDFPDGTPGHYVDFASSQSKHKINFDVSYDIGNWQFDSDLHFVSANHYKATVADMLNGRRAIDTRSYTILNARVGYKLKNNTFISLDGFNLIDKHFERPAYLASSRVGGSNKIGTTLLLSLRHDFR